MARLLLRELDLARPEVHLRERRDRLGSVGVAAELERGRERALEILHRLVRPAEQEGEAAEVVEHPADALPVGDLLVDRLRPLGVRAREHPLALPLGDERGLEEDVRDRLAVVRAPRRARAPARCPRAPPPSRAGGGSSGSATRGCARAADRRVARSPRRAGSPAEQRQRRRDRRELVAAAAEPVEHLGAVESLNRGCSAVSRARPSNPSAVAQLTEIHPRPTTRRASARTRSSSLGHSRPARS